MLIRWLVAKKPFPASEWGLVAIETNLVTGGLDLSAKPYLPTSWEAKVAEIKFSTNGQSLAQLESIGPSQCNLHKSPKWRG